MASPAVKVSVRINKRALDAELKSSNGSTGRTLAAFAGLVTREVNEVFIERAGGPWWRVKSTIFNSQFGVSATVNVRPSRPHVIKAKNASVLTFKFPDGSYFGGYSVNHPGSAVPERMVQEGVQNALKKKEYKFFLPNK